MTQYKFSIDSSAQACYLTMKDGDFEKTNEISPEILIDYDKSGNLLGVEFLSLESVEKFEPEALRDAMSDSELAEMKMLLSDHLNVKNAIAESRKQEIQAFTEYLISV
jgi:uncharacterized protein YuzE